MKILLLLSFLIIFGCNKNNSAEESLSSFVSYRFKTDQTLEGVSRYLSGDLYKMVSEMEENEVKDFFATKGLKKHFFKVESEKCPVENICFLTYRLKYTSPGKNENSYAMSVRKIAKLENFNGEWKISEIKNLKTFVDSKKDLIIN